MNGEGICLFVYLCGVSSVGLYLSMWAVRILRRP